MAFVLRRSLPSILGLTGLMLAVGFAAVAFLRAPLWFPVGFAVGMMLLQYLVNPWIIQWLVPATIVPHDGRAYGTQHPLGRIVADRCRQAGVPLVKLGVVEDGNPNAFTFGRTQKDARVWVTRGLVERLDETELDAVVAHEIGHIKHRDFILMTIAAVVPMALYLLYITARQADRDEARAVALGAYLAYIVSQFTVLSLSRAREYSADHWSCRATGNGDALCAALVKIAYGMGEVSARNKEAALALAAGGKESKKQARAIEARTKRVQSLRAMGIFEPRAAEAMHAALASGVEPERAVAAMRWDVVNPWGALLEKMSSHPLVARRIRALDESGLPGRPQAWSVLRSLATAPAETVMLARTRFAREITIAVAPWAILIPLVLFGAFTSSPASIGVALAAAGILFLVKQFVRYPGDHRPVSGVASLLERLDAGPVGGIPVELRGRIIGRGMPGYLLSPDLVVQDETGFVPLLYRQPIRLLDTLFGLFRAERFLGAEVVARGWYRRMPAPVVELRSVRTDDGRTAAGWLWAARFIGSGAVVLAGLIVLVVSSSA